MSHDSKAPKGSDPTDRRTFLAAASAGGSTLAAASSMGAPPTGTNAGDHGLPAEDGRREAGLAVLRDIGWGRNESVLEMDEDLCSSSTPISGRSGRGRAFRCVIAR